MQKSLTEQNWEKLSVIIIKVLLMQWNLVTLHFWPDCCTTFPALHGLGRICSQYKGGWQWPSDFCFLSSAALPAPIAWLVTTDILFSALEISMLKSFRLEETESVDIQSPLTDYNPYLRSVLYTCSFPLPFAVFTLFFTSNSPRRNLLSFFCFVQRFFTLSLFLH